MAKVSGYKIKLTAFLTAEPFNVRDLQNAALTFEGLRKFLSLNGFIDAEMSAEPGSKRLPDKTDSPAAAEPQIGGQASQAAAAGDADEMPEIPEMLDRRSK